jgi:hypothetical protein
MGSSDEPTGTAGQHRVQRYLEDGNDVPEELSRGGKHHDGGREVASGRKLAHG